MTTRTTRDRNLTVCILIARGRTKMTIAIYTRVSTDHQSTEHQQTAIANWVKKQGYDITDIIHITDEGISGKYGAERRPGYSTLLDGITKGKIRKVILFETSRASRDFLEYLRFLKLCHDNKCQVEAIDKGPILFENSQDMLMASIHAFLAQAEREKISERTRSGLAHARNNGIKLGAPKGNSYRQGKLKEHPQELIGDVLRLRKKGLTYREIASTIDRKYTQSPMTDVTIMNIFKRYSAEKN